MATYEFWVDKTSSQYKGAIGTLFNTRRVFTPKDTALRGAEGEPENNGEDATKPLDRFDLRFQVKTQPDSPEPGRVFEDRRNKTLTVRSDLKFVSEPDLISTRVDLPLVWSKKPKSGNPSGVSESGLGDLLLEAAYM